MGSRLVDQADDLALRYWGAAARREMNLAGVPGAPGEFQGLLDEAEQLWQELARLTGNHQHEPEDAKPLPKRKLRNPYYEVEKEDLLSAQAFVSRLAAVLRAAG